MAARLDAIALNQLFLDARTQNTWQAKDVPDALLRELVDVMKMGPTSANCSPARIVFVKSAAAKQRLAAVPLRRTTGQRPWRRRSAPSSATTCEFYEHLPRLFPHNLTARSWFEGKADHIATTALRNGSLQGAYFMLAARALGLDVGAMSGFDNAGVDREFFPEGHDQVELPVQHRLRRSGRRLRPLARASPSTRSR